jgi:hypothetical protein
MMTKHAGTVDPEIHALTRAEIARQLAAHAARRQQIVEQRADLYLRSSKSGTPVPSLSVEEKAARAHAKRLLNGVAPLSLDPPSSDINFSSLDMELAVEQRGLDITIKILSDNELVARAAEAVQWAESHAAEWRALVRETIVTAARLAALETAAARLIDKCVDIDAINLPMINLIGQKSKNVAWVGLVPITPDDLIEAGLKAGIVTNRDVEKVKNV